MRLVVWVIRLLAFSAISTLIAAVLLVTASLLLEYCVR